MSEHTSYLLFLPSARPSKTSKANKQTTNRPRKKAAVTQPNYTNQTNPPHTETKPKQNQNQTKPTKPKRTTPQKPTIATKNQNETNTTRLKCLRSVSPLSIMLFSRARSAQATNQFLVPRMSKVPLGPLHGTDRNHQVRAFFRAPCSQPINVS